MRFYDALREALRRDGTLTMADVSRARGTNAGDLGAASRGDSSPGVEKASSTLRAIGWRLVALPEGTAPEGSIRLGPTDAERMERERERVRREVERDGLIG